MACKLDMTIRDPTSGQGIKEETSSTNRIETEPAAIHTEYVIIGRDDQRRAIESLESDKFGAR